MSKAGRIRTESMIDRLGRKPLSEGFDMWDKDYMLGALRLFQCKLEVAPPFEQAACLDAVGDILGSIEEPEEAQEHYTQAVAKYEMIGKNVLAELMGCKAFELGEGRTADETLDRVEKVLSIFETRRAEGKTGAELLGSEAKGQAPALGRVYLYRTEMLGELGRHKEALESVELAINLGCDRVHLAHGVRGDVLRELGNAQEAASAYQQAIQEKPTFVPAYRSLINVYKETAQDDSALKLIDTAMQLHPSANLIREKAFLLSNRKADDEALVLLEEAIRNPPHDETDSFGDGGSSQQSTLRKAKVAILADLSRFSEAADELATILAAEPDDEEALSMKTDIFVALAREHVAKHGKEAPADLDSIVTDLLVNKPQASVEVLLDVVSSQC